MLWLQKLHTHHKMYDEHEQTLMPLSCVFPEFPEHDLMKDRQIIQKELLRFLKQEKNISCIIYSLFSLQRLFHWIKHKFPEVFFYDAFYKWPDQFIKVFKRNICYNCISSAIWYLLKTVDKSGIVFWLEFFQFYFFIVKHFKHIYYETFFFMIH